MTRYAKGAKALIASIASLVLFAGCGGQTGAQSETASKPVAGGTVTLGRTDTVTSFDLNKEIEAKNAFAIDKVFEPLVSFNQNGKIIPWLAKSYNISSDGRAYTFHLRDGVTFSDGSALSAGDVVFSLERHLKLGENAALPLDAPITGITAVDGSTVRITLKQAYTPLLAELSSFSNGILPKDFAGKSESEFFKKPVGTGPFTVKSWDPKGDLTFAKNTHYWQNGKPYVNELVYKYVTDDSQLLQQIQAGQIDAIDEVPYTNVSDLKNNSNVNVATSSSWAIEQVFFNTKNKHFADVHVRRAIAQAIDREGLVKAVTFGTGKVANALIPPTISYSANDEGYALAHDVNAAKHELAQSGYPNGFTARLAIKSGNSAFAQEAQIVQQALKPLGITVKIDSIDPAAFSTQVYTNLDYDFMVNSGQSDYPDPDELVSFQADPEGWSKSYWTSYTNDEVTKLLHEGRVTAPGDARRDIYLRIQRILAQEVPYIPLYYSANVKATTAKVHGLTILPNGSVPFQNVWIDKQ